MRLRFAVVLASVLGFGCATPTTLVEAYEPRPDRGASPLIEELVVDMGSDERPLGGRSSIGGGLLILIPLVPYGHQQIAPDRFTGSFSDDVLSTVVADLRAAGVARSVLKAGDRLPGQAAPVSPYTLEIGLAEGTLHRNVTAYGLSFFGVFLWMVGIPTAYGSSELAITAELREPSGRSLGTGAFEGEAGFAEGMYYNPFAPTATARLAEAYQPISEELRRFLRDSLQR
jgi:hypothetical protein